MKNKDQILLENLYSKHILKEEQLPKIPNDGYADGGEPYTDDELESINKKPEHSSSGEIRLKFFDGNLYTPFEVADDFLKSYYEKSPNFEDYLKHGFLLVDRDENDEVVTASWPDYDERELITVLYAARETGKIPSNTQFVILPDGKRFEID